ncbi:MAG: hypothetical protein JXR61_14095 [Prolixibacteraceae bacterium]|nr:hypothetical protein [Prolixibacteraceae bacterium]
MKAIVFLFLVIQLSLFNGSAQNLENALGGVKTNFQLFSDTTNLNPTNQMIIKRAEKKSSSDVSFGTGWGYGYQSFHIEFIADKNLTEKTFKYRAGRDNEDKLELTFHGSSNVVLATCLVHYSVVDLLYHSSAVSSRYFYSIDLIDIPLVLLNETVKINLIKRVSDRK